MAVAPTPGTVEAFCFFGGPSGEQAEPVLPSQTALIVARVTGWNGAFPTFTTLDARPVTFDLSPLLAKANGIDAAETIADIVSFGLIVDGPDGVQDAEVGSRSNGTPAIEGNLISQRFGPWQGDVGYIRYTVWAEVMTNRGNPFVVSADLNVVLPLD